MADKQANWAIAKKALEVDLFQLKFNLEKQELARMRCDEEKKRLIEATKSTHISIKDMEERISLMKKPKDQD